MCFADVNLGAKISFDDFAEKDLVKILFSENIGIVLQAKDDATFEKAFEGMEIFKIGEVTNSENLEIDNYQLSIVNYRKKWFETSFLLDQKQTKN